ncbi:DUF3397 family protein [Radiobacillus kanasensis]|uniref:DUF3397 family protein n=1 Tax=Radiobacillus kanasensis TaxID=2844358 RepID=UPI001E628AC2|nr:DUF3397 family protein [Radiobacillus kanasensis]UFU00931.1 DUF3397 family protein [Radiobacillus kanasensis]
MIEVFSYVIGFLITFPFLVSLLVFFASYTWNKQGWKSVHRMVRYTTFLYILAVGVLLQDILELPVFGFLLIGLLILLSIFLIVERNINGEVVFLRAWKMFWRFSFLLFFFLYILLVFYGIFARVFHL